MTEIALQAKRFQTEFHVAYLARPHLCAWLNTILGRKLALLSAPAGFGKIVLLTSWLDQLRALSEQMPVPLGLHLLEVKRVSNYQETK